MKAEKDFYLDADRQLTEKETERAFFLIGKGQEIPPQMQEQYFSKKADKKPADENKAVAPTENKAAKKK